MNLEEYQYHPRYQRSEWDDYIELERKANRRAFFAVLLIVGCVAGFIYTFA